MWFCTCHIWISANADVFRYPLQGVGELIWASLIWLSVYHRHRLTNLPTLNIHTYGAIEFLVHVTWVCLDCGRKPEYPEETHFSPVFFETAESTEYGKRKYLCFFLVVFFLTSTSAFTYFHPIPQICACAVSVIWCGWWNLPSQQTTVWWRPNLEINVYSRERFIFNYLKERNNSQRIL